MNQYAYDGPVMEWVKSTTYAVSEKKARSNLVYRFKKQHNRLPNTRITLPGKLIAAGERRK